MFISYDISINIQYYGQIIIFVIYVIYSKIALLKGDMQV